MKIPLNWTAPFIRIVYEIWCRTLRIKQVWRHNLNDLADAGQPVIVAFWHDEIFPIMHKRGKQKLAAIVSQSSDGELLARVLESMDIKTARGSSSRGGVKALIKAAQLMRKEKRAMCISVDGPRGPRHEVKEGIIHLARLTGAQIVPLRSFMSKRKVFASWDRFQLPLPFSKVKMVFNTPYHLEYTKESKDDRESLAREVQKLKALLDAMDSMGEESFKE